MKNKCILVLLTMALTACSTAKKIAIGNGSTVQVPKNAKKISLQEFNAVNEKFQFPVPATALDNKFIADNVLISFHNLRNMEPNERNLEQMKKDIDGMYPSNLYSPISVTTINNNQVLTWRIKNNNQFSISFFCNNATNKLAVNGMVQAAVSDSTKVYKAVDFIVKHVKFGN